MRATGSSTSDPIRHSRLAARAAGASPCRWERLGSDRSTTIDACPSIGIILEVNSFIRVKSTRDNKDFAPLGRSLRAAQFGFILQPFRGCFATLGSREAQVAREHYPLSASQRRG